MHLVYHLQLFGHEIKVQVVVVRFYQHEDLFIASNCIQHNVFHVHISLPMLLNGYSEKQLSTHSQHHVTRNLTAVMRL